MLQAAIIKKTLRVPMIAGQEGNGEHLARQLDIALMGVGFKLSRDLLEHLAHAHPEYVTQQSIVIFNAVKELVGDHVQHNVYFINFPSGVPDTKEFWLRELFRYILTGDTHYGCYQHSYEEMLALHDEFLPSVKDRVTVLHLGASLHEETLALYHQLACSTTPLNEHDRLLVKELAEACLHHVQPDFIPMRETKAIINAVRLLHGCPFSVDTITDVLRLACAVSGGDVTLQESTKFPSFTRHTRRMLLRHANGVIHASPAQLADVHQYQEQWKRLGEKLHPHEYASVYPHAASLFAVARGETKTPTLAAKVEAAFSAKDIPQAIHLLKVKPGMLLRSVDRLLRNSQGDGYNLLMEELPDILPHVSGRVVLGVREHIHNRQAQQTQRIFANSKGRAWVTPDTRRPLDTRHIASLTPLLDSEITRRLPRIAHLVVDRDVLGVALPLSDKNKASGFSVLPRGSQTNVGNGLLRFFVYWKQTKQRTDYDLSAMLLNGDFQCVDQLSYTNLRSLGGTHSGDLTDATHGATEFIDIDLSRVRASFIVPTINVFSGEDFTEAESCFFGLMQRDKEQQGKPFEARTVRFKSDIRGNGRVALPVVFRRENEQWVATWAHLLLKGRPNFNRVESTHLSTGVLTRSIVERKYLTMDYLVSLLQTRATTFSWYERGMTFDEPVTFLGLEAPEGLPKDSTMYTLSNLQSLLPA